MTVKNFPFKKNRENVLAEKLLHLTSMFVLAIPRSKCRFLHLTSILVGEPTSLAYRLLAPPRSRKALLSLALNRYAYPCRKLNKKPLKARLYNKKIYKFFSSHFLYKSWRLDFVLAIFCSILNSLISLWFPLSRTSGTSNPRYSLGFVY